MPVLPVHSHPLKEYIPTVPLHRAVILVDLWAREKGLSEVRRKLLTEKVTLSGSFGRITIQALKKAIGCSEKWIDLHMPDTFN